MSRLLSAVTRAAQRRHAAEHAYKAAVRAANEAGHSFGEIGRAAGITRQGARQLLHDSRKGKP